MGKSEYLKFCLSCHLKRGCLSMFWQRFMQKPAQNKPKHIQSFIAKPARPKLPSPPCPCQTTFYFAHYSEVHNIFDTIFFIAHCLNWLAGNYLSLLLFYYFISFIESDVFTMFNTIFLIALSGLACRKLPVKLIA